jgi:hypothetical protein
MTYTLKVSYVGCQTCHARVNCDECEKRLEEAMMRLQCVHGASLMLPRKILLIDADQTEDELVEQLEDLGIFCD